MDKIAGGGYLLENSGYILWLHELEESKGLTEYKIFCFNGKPRIVLVCKGGEAHTSGRTNDFCDLDFNRFPFVNLNPQSEGVLEKPLQLAEMLEIAIKLSAGIPQLRIDFYIVSGQVYIGELTFYHNAGFCAFEPQEWDEKLGSWIQLPEREV